ncbi:MAG TPA: hypothetical protein VKR79_09485 [Gaiellaceae bacterium]|nr:hypothetical protein [Gaiellaceae bacterium]
MRIALVIAVVLAIVLPTALISSAPGPATVRASEVWTLSPTSFLPSIAPAPGPSFGTRQYQTFSVEQVLRVFKAEGVVLRREPNGAGTSETFALGSADYPPLEVTVFQPQTGSGATGFLSAFSGNAVPELAGRGNVIASWTGRTLGKKVDRALHRLRYSPADAALSPPPTIVLHPPNERAVDIATAPAGTEVDCVNGSSDASEIVSRSRAASSTSTYSGNDVAAILSWRPLQGSRLAFSCSAVAPAPPASALRQSVDTSQQPCQAGPRLVRAIGLDAHVPYGWYIAYSRSQDEIWLANRARCDRFRTPVQSGIYLTIMSMGQVPDAFPPHRQGFVIHVQPAAKPMFTVDGLDDDFFFTPGQAYAVQLLVGKGLRNTLGLRIANRVLKDITPR